MTKRGRGKANPDTADQPHAVYRCWDSDGVLLYVGCSKTPEKRWLHWRQNKAADWPLWTTRREVEWFPDERVGRAAESAAIRDERPLFNVRGNDAHDNSRAGIRDERELLDGRVQIEYRVRDDGSGDGLPFRTIVGPPSE